MVDDFMDFQRLRGALASIGIDKNEQLGLFQLLAGILHLGNIEFEALEGDTRGLFSANLTKFDNILGGCTITAKSENSLNKAAELFGLDSIELRMGLTTRFMQPTRSGALGTLIQ
jgi:hypothetical protein